jgi:proteasome assembly chaperone (PAC2) family protein
MLLVLMSLSVYCQGLSPDKVSVQQGDTLFCWKLPKTRSIVKKIIQGDYCDSISTLQQEIISDKDSISDVQKKTIEVLKSQKKNLDSIVVLRDKEIVLLKGKEFTATGKIIRQVADYTIKGLAVIGGLAIVYTIIK